MIKKLFEKNETFACIALIVIYVVVNSACLQNFDTTDIRCALIYGGSTALIIISLAYAFYIDRKVKD